MNIQNLTFPNHLFILGRSMSGKSNIINHIIHTHKDKFVKIAVFGRANYDSRLVDYQYSFEITDESSDDISDRIRKRATLILNRSARGIDTNQTPILLIFDDILFVNFRKHSDFWGSFISDCRHQNISLIFSIQHYTGISSVMRSNVRYIMCTSVNNDIIDKIQNYTLLTRSELRDMVMNLEKYQFLYIDTSQNSLDIFTVSLFEFP